MSKTSKAPKPPAPHYADWEVIRHDGEKITVAASELEVSVFHAGVTFTDAAGVSAHFAEGSYSHVLRAGPEHAEPSLADSPAIRAALRRPRVSPGTGPAGDVR